jgi:plastocyanin
MRLTTPAVWAALSAALAACGGSSYTSPSAAPSPTPSGPTITISNLAFSPLDLHVPAGATVTVVNRDAMLHSVTSEASANAFTRGSVGGIAFDTGQFAGTRTFSIPANAASGTVVPYYCTAHLGAMATPNGTITIDPSASTTTAAPTPSPGMPGY